MIGHTNKQRNRHLEITTVDAKVVENVKIESQKFFNKNLPWKNFINNNIDSQLSLIQSFPRVLFRISSWAERTCQNLVY